MKRRDFLQLSALTGATTLGDGAMAAAATNSARYDLAERDARTLQAWMTRAERTSKQIVRAYLARIRAIDKSGPRINSIIELNPDAEAIAAERDRERKAGKVRGPLHGIPILLKDNIATADKMQTTAGSLALAGVKPPRDAHIVKRLTEAGAVILGKTNLSEWANFRSIRSTSGWSARGGLSKNPYALDRNTSGSSSGSGAAIAASLAAIAVGTETDGSIISPCNVNGLVGLKPTLGLVSRTGIIPIAHSQDTAGPMARTVTDAALLLSVLAGTDTDDAETAPADARRSDYLAALDKDALQGARIGVVKNQFGGRNDLASAVVEKELEVLRQCGAVLVDVPELPNAGKLGAHEYEVLLYEFKADMAAYLKSFAPGATVKSLADLIAFNEKHKDKELKYFGQEHMTRAEAKGDLASKEYLEALATGRRLSREEGIDKVLAEHKLEALVAPSGGPAWLTDFIRGDNAGGGFTTPAAVAGYPHVTVPAGFVHGLPVGMSFVGGAWSEARLIGFAYAYEQASKRRRAPRYLRTAAATVLVVVEDHQLKAGQV
ncbi:MAG: amidase [Betaproteobacteria bacterium]|nr:amidase [Betaproteobacteria bacterium]